MLGFLIFIILLGIAIYLVSLSSSCDVNIQVNVDDNLVIEAQEQLAREMLTKFEIEHNAVEAHHKMMEEAIRQEYCKRTKGVQ